jgi:large subunit ribosomal protein L20
MPRAKTGIVRRRRHQKLLKRAKGFWGLRSKSFRIAQQTLLNAADYAYRDRRDKKNVFRRLWIARINAAARLEGMNYSNFVAGLRRSGRRARPQGARRPRGPRTRRLQGAGRAGALRLRPDPVATPRFTR